MVLIRHSTTRILIFVGVCLSLQACDSSSRSNTENTVVTQPPPIIPRMIYDNLGVEVRLFDSDSVEENPSVYLGRKVDDGEWTVVVQATAGKTYTVEAIWYATDDSNTQDVRLKIASQSGSFDADPASADRIELALDTSKEFDADCDGQFNLDEINALTDPLDANSPVATSGCDSVVEDPNPTTEPPPVVDDQNPSGSPSNDPTVPADNTDQEYADSVNAIKLALSRGEYLEPETVFVDAAGKCFTMGSPENEIGRQSDEQQHSVCFTQNYRIGKFEISFEQFDRYSVDATGGFNRFQDRWGRGKQPAIQMTWSAAEAYTRWISSKTGRRYRLPTEAEWEFAIRGGTDSTFWTGNTINANQENINSETGWAGGDPIGVTPRTQTLEVGSLAANPYGLHDMAGNALEWTCDSYDAVNGNHAETPHTCIDIIGAKKVIRSGWYSSQAAGARSAFRSSLEDFNIDGRLGFRVLLEE